MWNYNNNHSPIHFEVEEGEEIFAEPLDLSTNQSYPNSPYVLDLQAATASMTDMIEASEENRFSENVQEVSSDDEKLVIDLESMSSPTPQYKNVQAPKRLKPEATVKADASSDDEIRPKPEATVKTDVSDDENLVIDVESLSSPIPQHMNAPFEGNRIHISKVSSDDEKMIDVENSQSPTQCENSLITDEVLLDVRKLAEVHNIKLPNYDPKGKVTKDDIVALFALPGMVWPLSDSRDEKQDEVHVQEVDNGPFNETSTDSFDVSKGDWDTFTVPGLASALADTIAKGENEMVAEAVVSEPQCIYPALQDDQVDPEWRDDQEDPDRATFGILSRGLTEIMITFSGYHRSVEDCAAVTAVLYMDHGKIIEKVHVSSTPYSMPDVCFRRPYLNSLKAFNIKLCRGSKPLVVVVEIYYNNMDMISHSYDLYPTYEEIPP